MAAQTGVPGLAVTLTAGGALLVYAGLRGVSPLTALREIAAGQTEPITTAGFREPLDTSVGGGGAVYASSGTVGAGAAGIADGAMRYRGDKYSQSLRSRPGYSDCSSFAARAMRAAGINVPDYNTTAFMRWSGLKRIDKSEITRGDLLINSVHMAIALDGSTAIGQQNKRRNVATGSFEAIMMNTGPWSAYRYVGGSGKTAVT